MALRAEKISKRYFRRAGASNHFYAVQETDFAVSKGTLSVLVGRSGSGKTTLLNMLAGLITPTEGKVFLDDADLYALDDNALSLFRSRRMGVIPQGRASVDTLTVMENILLPVMLYGKKPEKGAAERAEALLKQLGIEHLKDAMPHELSGGEMRRMAIVRALAHSPEVIFADEPTGDLDDENTQLVLKLLREAADHGAMVVLVTHETAALSYADRVYRMDGGVILPEEVIK